MAAKGTQKKSVGEFADRYPGAKPLHSSGDMFQWDEVGQELVGRFGGIKEFKNGHIASMQTADGRVAFSAPTLLADDLKSIQIGTEIAIVFSKEDEPVRRGQSGLKHFEIYSLNSGGGRGRREETQSDE